MDNKKTPKIIAESKTSIFVFAIPAALTALLLFYLFKNFLISNVLIVSFVILCIWIQPFNLFHKKKIILTTSKIYVYSKDKKIISWSLSDDFKYIEYSQNKYGKMFGFGKLTIVNKSDQSYVYSFLADPQMMYEKIILRYERVMQKLDPTFISSYKKIEENKLDKL